MNSEKTGKNAKKADNVFKKFFKCCLSTAHERDQISKVVKFAICFMKKKTNLICALKYQNEYFDKFYYEFCL